MISVEDLSYTYNGNETIKYPNFRIDTQKNLLILGESGVGKSTLLHLLSGLLKIQSGTIMVNNTSLGTLAQKDLDRYRGNEIGLVLQSPTFIKSLTVFENLELKNNFSSSPKTPQELYDLLTSLQIENKTNVKTQNLSLGQQQRLSIAMALVNAPKLILADEPTASLDATNTERVITLLKEKANEFKANLIVITHDQRVIPHFTKQIQL